MSFLLDTNVLSEPTRPKANAGVLEWLDAADEDRLFVSAASLAELHLGVERLPMGKRRQGLHDWLSIELTERFRSRILDIDESVARVWGLILAQREETGRSVGVIDGFLAATAQVYNLTLITRNVRDFEGLVPSLINPWTERR